MEVTNWLKYWRDALITGEKLAVDEKVLQGATTCERADALNGILQDQDTIRELKNLGRDAASGVGQRIILAPYVWSQRAQSGRPSTAYPALVASVAVPAILDSNGRLAPDPAAYPYIPRALLTPSLAALTVGRGQPWGQPFTYDIWLDTSGSQTFEHPLNLVRRIRRLKAPWWKAPVSKFLASDVRTEAEVARDLSPGIG